MRRKKEKENTIVRVYKNKLMPTKAQARRMEELLEIHRKLYNMCHWERVFAYDVFQNVETGKPEVPVTLDVQKKALTAFKKDVPEHYDGINRNALDETIMRLDESWKRFFSDLKKFKKGQIAKPGRPHFKKEGEFNSWVYSRHGNGYKIPDWNDGDKRIRIYIQELGSVKMWCNLKMEGSFGKGSIVRDGGDWYFCVTSTLDAPKTPVRRQRKVGIDLGVEYFLSCSDGRVVDNPRSFEKDLDRYRRLHSDYSRRQDGSNNQERDLLLLQRKYKRIRNLRQEFIIETANDLVEKYDLIVLEKFKIRSEIEDGKTKESFLSKKRRAALKTEKKLASMLSLSISDTSWYRFFTTLKYKAEEAGVSLVLVKMREDIDARKREVPSQKNAKNILQRGLYGVKVILDSGKQFAGGDVEIVVTGKNIRSFVL